MCKRKIFLEGKFVNLVEQEALLDAECFLKSRKDADTLELIGDSQKNFNFQEIFDEMHHREIYGNTFPEKVWTIVNRADNRYLGDIHLYATCPGYEIKVVILPEERCKGYGTEAVTLLVNYLFEITKISAVYVKVLFYNKRAFFFFMRLNFVLLYTVSMDYSLPGHSKCYAYVLGKS